MELTQSVSSELIYPSEFDETTQKFHDDDIRLRNELNKRINDAFSNEKHFLLQPIIPNEAYFYKLLLNRHFCNESFHLHHPFRVVNHSITCNDKPIVGIVCMSAQKYAADNATLKLLQEPVVSNSAALGKAVYGKLVFEDLSTSVVLDNIYELGESSESWFSSSKNFSGHSLARLSDLPAYRHDPEKRLRCNRCKKSANMYCVQCTLFHGFPEICTVCKHCEGDHGKAGYVAPMKARKVKKYNVVRKRKVTKK